MSATNGHHAAGDFANTAVSERFASRVMDLAVKMGVTAGDMCLALEKLIACSIIAYEPPGKVDDVIAVAQRNLKTFADMTRAEDLAQTPPEGRG